MRGNKQWDTKEIGLVADRAASTITESRSLEINQKELVRQVDIAQRHALHESRWRNFKNQNRLVYGTIRETAENNIQLAVVARLVKAGWREDGTRVVRYTATKGAPRLSTLLPPVVHGPASFEDVVGKPKEPAAPAPAPAVPAPAAPAQDIGVRIVIRNDIHPEAEGIASIFSAILTRLDALEAKAAEAPKIDNAEVAALREEVSRLKDETQNALGFDDLIIEELDQLREITLQVSRGIKTEVPPPARAPLVERQGKGPVVTVIGLRNRDEAVLNMKLRTIPETSKLDVRYIESARSPYQFKSEYVLVTRWGRHSWFDQAKKAVSETANCRFVTHGGAAEVAEELRRIALENQGR